MNATERRRVALASIVTLVALPTLWVANRESTDDTVVAVGGEAQEIGSETAPPTTAYSPELPAFVGGDDEPVLPGVVDVAVPPPPNANEVSARAAFARYNAVGRVCTTLLAPDGALLTIRNVDNGQTTTCTNTLGKAVPPGADVVLDTNIYTEIANLADAPVPVRMSW